MRKTMLVMTLMLGIASFVLFAGQIAAMPVFGATIAALLPLGAQPAAAGATSPVVNVRPTVGTIDWALAPIFWFGRATDQDNYVDVRVAYDSQALYVNATIVDYYLWDDPNGSSDPRQYDALAVHIDTANDGSTTPQASSYAFVDGMRQWPTTNDTRWHRQARGNGTSWNTAWSPATPWTESVGTRFYNSGPNNNSDKDAGWTATIRVPWEALGLTGMPAAGSKWRLGTLLYDQDASPVTGTVTMKSWPGGFADSDPMTWGVLSFDPTPFTGSRSPASGITTVRRGLNGAAVADTYVGGGGNCAGGVFGGGDVAHGTDNLFVQNQADVSDFPCFSKSYLKFDLSGIPPGKAIISATLRIYEFGGSDPTQARPSAIQLFEVADDWDEATLTWNNAPMARENVAVSTVGVITNFPGWPGVLNVWDSTQAVTDAYAAGRPVNIALYSADQAYHSGKYFISSESGDWNAAGRPTLIVEWGERPLWQVFLPSVIK